MNMFMAEGKEPLQRKMLKKLRKRPRSDRKRVFEQEDGLEKAAEGKARL